MKTSERCRATWNLRRLIGEPLREISMIIAHDVESGFLGKRYSASMLCISATCSQLSVIKSLLQALSTNP
jgi:hypothetical protein